MTDLHRLRIMQDENLNFHLKLDGFEIKGINDYDLMSDMNSPDRALLTVSLYVRSINADDGESSWNDVVANDEN